MRGKLVLFPLWLVALVAFAPPTAGAATTAATVRIFDRVPYEAQPGKPQVRVWRIHYRAHDGTRRKAYVALPAWYGPNERQPIPLVISPHGRGVSARANALIWGALPARGLFGVISPEGAGRKLSRYSWGSAGQIDDLARMPEIASRTLPWLQVDRSRIYAVGGSMGGQETLLLLARYPRLLAGAAAFDSVADFARQYRSFPSIPCGKTCRKRWNGPVGRSLQSLARQELGGTPRTRPGAYAVRSPVTYVRAIAASCVPLQLWWSMSDRIVANQRHQSGALFDRIRELNPRAPVQAYVGHWKHSNEMRASTRLPLALANLGLLPEPSRRLEFGIRVVSQPPTGARCGASGERPRTGAGITR